MNWTDAVNGGYESLASLFLLINVMRLHRDKECKGVSIAPTAFFASWGYWNLFFFPYNGLWFSAIACGLVALVNTFWVGQMIYYSRRQK